MERTVGSNLVIDVAAAAEIVLAVTVSDLYDTRDERLEIRGDGRDITADEHVDAYGTRLLRIHAPVGALTVAYEATVTARVRPAVVSDMDRFVFLRPSRFIESDVLAAVAAAEFQGVEPRQMLQAVSSWVGTRLAYVSGSSGPTDGAVDTMLARRGVCRDYAHLTAALLRARGIPARVVAVYAPGLAPMDFHAVVEAEVDGVWCAVDSTALAPRSSLVRIATGRDAADTAFMTTLSGRADLREISVSAVADSLPSDDLDSLVSIT